MTFRLPSMPLVARELAQMSGRAGTYRLRFWMGVALVVPALFTVLTASVTARPSVAGIGYRLAETQFFLLQWAVYLVLPVLMAETIAGERQNRTLAPLFTTDLSPWEIIVQKYLSRLVPIATLMLLSAPVFAVAYAYGGLTIDTLSRMLFVLALTIVQVGALGILASAVCRTTTSALLTTYAFGCVFYFGPYLLARLFSASAVNWWTDTVLLSWAPFLIEHHAMIQYMLSGSNGPMPFPFLPGALVLLTSVFLLSLAPILLVRLRTETSRPVGVRFSQWDAVLNRLNAFVGNVRIGRDGANLPADRPVLWREMTRLGLTPRDHFIRLLLMVEIPLLFVITMLAAGGADYSAWGWLVAITWCACGVFLLVLSASSLPAEQSNQTFDVLITTPLYSTEIVGHKYLALNRLFLLLLVPCGTTLVPLLLSLCNEWGLEFLFYSVFAFASMVANLQTAVFVGLYCGAKSPARLRAIFTTFLSVIGIAVGWSFALAFSMVFCVVGPIVVLPTLIGTIMSVKDRFLRKAADLLRPTLLGNVPQT